MLGGPAIVGHRELIEIYKLRANNEIERCKEAIDDLIELNPQVLFQIYGNLLKDAVDNFEIFRELSILLYNSLLRRIYSIDPSRKLVFNHNLAIRIDNFLSSLDNF